MENYSKTNITDPYYLAIQEPRQEILEEIFFSFRVQETEEYRKKIDRKQLARMAWLAERERQQKDRCANVFEQIKSDGTFDKLLAMSASQKLIMGNIQNL
ncbi:hypothetical protein LX64_04769 [Chitinophaga skermanii]|uniref:Uncharacterized protein n=1 Tax=Chitinophaga skermanii TaxID=331697 RepID=A0A327Q3S0_9BACT|nr:hypothetical protein [Chitinophaga skermanii]RAI98407.1 hypothetical protein LX64_04769 [Chitinophaga skermanii]